MQRYDHHCRSYGQATRSRCCGPHSTGHAAASFGSQAVQFKPIPRVQAAVFPPAEIASSSTSRQTVLSRCLPAKPGLEHQSAASEPAHDSVTALESEFSTDSGNGSSSGSNTQGAPLKAALQAVAAVMQQEVEQQRSSPSQFWHRSQTQQQQLEQQVQVSLQYRDRMAPSTSNSSSSSMNGGSKRMRGNNILGGAYTPGLLWHVKRDWQQPAAAATSTSVLYSTASTTTSSNSSSTELPSLLQHQSSTLQQQEQEQQQQQQEFEQLLHGDELDTAAADVDFTLLDRRESHAAASGSGRQHNSSSSSWVQLNGSSSSTLRQQQQQQRSLKQQDEAAGATVTAEAAARQLLALRRSPAANFRDSAFEQGLSRWMKEAPDWFKVRAVYERYGHRFNLVHVACALSRLADLRAAVLANKQLLRGELLALNKFTAELLGRAGELLPSTDAGTAAALLHSLSKLAAAKKLRAARNSSELVGSVLSHVEPCLCTLEPSELAQMVWALKRLKYSPSEAWFQSLFAQTQPLLTQLKGLEVALLLRGLAATKSPIPPIAWTSTLLSHVEGLLADMEPKHLTLLFMGLGGLKLQPPGPWMMVALDVLRSKFDQMGPQALSNVLWGISRLGVLPDRPWLNAYFSASLQLLNSFNRQEMSVDMWSLSRLRLEPSDQWLDEYFDISEAQMIRFTMRDLAMIGYSLAKLGLRPPQTWLRRYCALLLRHKGQLWHNKILLTQVMVALDSFRVPRMDMWRREMYAAAGYKLYKYRDWRQRVKHQPMGPYSNWPFSRRRLSRRSSGSIGSSRFGGVAAGAAKLPAVLRSGDWGVMDAMGGARGVLGSMSSYEELGAAAVAAQSVPPRTDSSSSSSSAAAAVAAVPRSWSNSSSSSSVGTRPLRSAGLVRPSLPAQGVVPAAGSSSNGSNGSSMAEGSMTDADVA